MTAPETATENEVTALDWFRTLYPGDQGGHLVLWTRQDRRSEWFSLANLAGASARAVSLAATRDVYFGIGLHPRQLGPDERGRGDGVCALPGLWLDLDVAGPAHQGDDLPPDRGSARRILDAFPPQPTAVVDSGHGFQAWWLFPELWRFQSEAERKAAEELSRRFQATLVDIGRRMGWHVDATHDLARVLRVPGTLNRKLTPVPVEVVELELERRYRPEDFEPHLVGIEMVRVSTPAVEGPIAAQHRNTTLASLAGTMRRRGFGQDGITAALMAENTARCDPPLPEAEVRAIAKSIAKKAPQEASVARNGHGAEPLPEPPDEDDAADYEPDDDDRRGDGRRVASIPAPWDTPAPIGRSRTLPAFPAEAFPSWLGDYLRALSVATQTPVDLAGMLVLSTLAAVAGGLARVEVRPGWREPLNLFTAVAMPPGSRKSAVFADVTAPLTAFDREELERKRGEIIEAETSRKIAEGAALQAQNAAAKAPAANAAELAEEASKLAAKAAAMLVPPMPRLLADDATPEALSTLLVEHGRIALMAPEGDVFDMMAGRYQSGGGPNLGVYLKGHAGDAIRVDRKGRGPEFAPAPALTVGLAVQPEVLRSIADRPGFRGRGLLARFLFSLPVNTVGARAIAADPVPEEVRNTYRTETRVLARSLLDEAELAALCSNEDDDLLLLHLSPEAASAVVAFETELEPRLAPEAGDLGHVADWSAKLAGAVVRMAGLRTVLPPLAPTPCRCRSQPLPQALTASIATTASKGLTPPAEGLGEAPPRVPPPPRRPGACRSLSTVLTPLASPRRSVRPPASPVAVRWVLVAGAVPSPAPGYDGTVLQMVTMVEMTDPMGTMSTPPSPWEPPLLQ